MELGEKLKQARLEAGLSQRQLCADTITRNMLSQIEHGTANPSMDTLICLAGRLGKPLGWFLGDDTPGSPNHGVMADARAAFDAGDPSGALEALESYREPDAVYDRERQMLQILALLDAAQSAVEQGRKLYALELLGKAGELGVSCAYYTPDLERRRCLLLGQVKEQNAAQICPRLPSVDDELHLRARAALESEDPQRAAALLDAAENHASPQWNFLRGEAYRLQGEYTAAAACFHLAEKRYPGQTIPRLEQCYRESGDFKQAYYYACKQK